MTDIKLPNLPNDSEYLQQYTMMDMIKFATAAVHIDRNEQGQKEPSADLFREKGDEEYSGDLESFACDYVINNLIPGETACVVVERAKSLRNKTLFIWAPKDEEKDIVYNYLNEV